jgi:hypothetical protein
MGEISVAIINYYEKYGFSQTDELEKIQWVINQKITDEENDSFGEGHSDKLFILQLAKEAFETANSKAKYDQDLADSLKKRDPDGERKASLDKWYGDAQNYFSTNQFDLAKTAIDRAMQYSTPETVDSDFYDTAASIYASLKLFSQALELENQSIVISPEEPKGYYLKCRFLYSYIFERNLGNDKMQDIYNQLRNNCELAIKKVIAQKRDYQIASQCYEIMAEINYVYVNRIQFPITGNNNTLAEEYALKSIAILNGEEYDCTVAKKILDDIAARRNKIAELEEENSRLRTKLKKDSNELENQLKDLKDTDLYLKDSINNATTFGDTEFGGVVWVGIIAGIVAIIAFALGGAGFGAFCTFISVCVFGIRGAIVSKNKNIRDTLTAIYKNNGEISNKNSELERVKRDINAKIDQNNGIISKQSAGLAKEPIKIPEVIN